MSARRHRSRLVPALISGTLLGGVAALTGCAWSEEPPVVRSGALGASLDLAAGEVMVVDGEARRPVLSGTPLPEGATLETGAGARALVRLGDGTRVFMDGSSTVALGRVVSLQRGRIWLESPAAEEGIDPHAHEIGEASVTLSDGGASLRVGEDGAEIYVAEGLAIVTSPGGRQEVNAGEMATVSGAGAPALAPVKFFDDWTGGMSSSSATGLGGGSGSGALYAVDRSAPAGSKALPLSIQRQTVQVAIEDQVAETLVDQRFFNPASTDVEGWYWFSVPEDAMLVSFALETDGQLIEAEVVERRQAAAEYEAAVTRQRDPALLEWIDERTVRARIYPVPAGGERRVVVRYQQLLSETEDKLRFAYPLAPPAGRDPVTIEEFSLEVQLHGRMKDRFSVSTSSAAKVEQGGERITMRRSGYRPRADFELELTRTEREALRPVRVNVVEAGDDQAAFLMLRYVPDVDFSALRDVRGDVVVVVDTSAAGDSAEYQARVAVAEALLRSLSKDDRFALMSADLDAQVLYPEAGLGEATPENISAALEALAQHGTGGATDLGSIFERALSRVHGMDQPAIVYVGDGMATSGAREGDALRERLRRSLGDGSARLYTVGVGAEVDEALLGGMARVGGGEMLRVHDAGEAVVRALQLSGFLKTPTITDLELDVGEGLDEVFVNASGRLSRGQELVMLARSHQELPSKVTVRGKLGGEPFEKTYDVVREEGVLDELVPRLWATAYVERLLGDARGLAAVRGKIISLGLEYGLMTPFTSLLALESEDAYAEAGIERRRRRFPGPRLTADASWSRGSRAPAPAAPRTVIGQFLSAASVPVGCTLDEATQEAHDREIARWEREGPDERPPGAHDDAPLEEEWSDEEAGGAGSRHKGEEGKMGRPSSKSSSGMYAMKGPKDAIPQMDRNFDAPGSPPPSAAPKPKKASEPRMGGSGGRRDKLELGGYEDSLGLGDDFEDSGAAALRYGDHGPGEIDNERGDGMGFAPGAGEALRRPLTRTGQVERLREHMSPMTSSPVSPVQALPCSDVAARGLSHRRVLWRRRLDQVDGMGAWLGIYEASVAACEVPDWKDQRAFLGLLQERVSTENDVGLLLAHFSAQPVARNYLSAALLRRLVDPRLVAAVENAMFGRAVNWRLIDWELAREVDDAKQLELLTKALERAPGDPEGERRMMALLVTRGELDAAIGRGRRLRERGLMTPGLAEYLGELMVKAGRDDEARRLFSEIVEFDPDSARSRALLGDIFLRHGWYDHAYEQYADLLEMLGDEPVASMRLARAAAGSGRTDEALRLLRRVAAGEGRPGAQDPRRWARLLAATYLSDLRADPPEGASVEQLDRELKRLQLFEGPGRWTILSWQDLGAYLVLVPRVDEGEERDEADEAPPPLAGDLLDAWPVGVVALQHGVADDQPLDVRHRGERLDREVRYRIVTLTWDGERFDVSIEEGAIEALQANAKLESKADEPARSAPEGESP